MQQVFEADIRNPGDTGDRGRSRQLPYHLRSGLHGQPGVLRQNRLDTLHPRNPRSEKGPDPGERDGRLSRCQQVEDIGYNL